MTKYLENNKQEIPKNNKKNYAIQKSSGGNYMKPDHIKDIIWKSIESGKGDRTKYLKVYVRFFCSNYTTFNKERRKRIASGGKNEYKSSIAGYEFFFDEWDWGIVAYHTQDEEGTQRIEHFLKNHPALRMPWLDKKRFYKLAQMLTENGGKIVNERGSFLPYNDYSGYGISIEVRGRKTKEVIDEIEDEHALHPRRIGIQIGKEKNSIKFDMTNRGRLSFSRGPVNSRILIIGKYVNYFRKEDELYYEYKQSHKITIENLKARKIEEIIKMKLPSIKKIRGTQEERNNALINLVTSTSGAYGYIGIPIGSNRANILDLKEKKFLQLTISGDTLYVYSENPSESRSAIRRLSSKIASYIDPDVRLEKMTIGGK